jgi:predicted branched-subunit amino acid permease
MARRSTTYIWQFVIGLGFLSGVWTATGIDPSAVIFNILGRVTEALWPNPAVQSLVIILPTLLLVVTIIQAYRKGGLSGLVAVVVAYLAGLSVLVALSTAIIFLVVAIVLAYLATNPRLVRKLAGR